MRVSTLRRWAEGIGAGLAIALLGLLRPADPAFQSMGFLPQALVGVVIGALLGSGPGIASLAATAAATLAVGPLGQLLGLGLRTVPLPGLLEAARLPLALALAGTAAAGFLRDADLAAAGRLRGRLAELVHRLTRLEKVNEALVALNEGLMQRVSGQRDSISALHARIRKMDSLELARVLDGVLEAVSAFSQARAVGIFEYDARDQVLRLAAWTGPEPLPSLGIEDSVEGWTFRNDSIFTLRRLDDYLGLGHVDLGQTVLAYPLKAGDLPWGVVSVGEMPFYRYNPVMERNIEVVVELAGAYVRRAADFRDRALAGARDEITGLPGPAELLALLAEELERRQARHLPVSVAVVELMGFDVIVSTHGRIKAMGLIAGVVEATGRKEKVYAFHGREEGQVAFILPDLDREGASLFCLQLSQGIGASHWSIDRDPVCVEPAFGIGAWPKHGPAPLAAGAGMTAGTEEAEELEELEEPGAARAGEEYGEAAGISTFLEAETLLSEAEAVLDVSRAAYLEHGRCDG